MDGPSAGTPRFLNRALDRGHFDLHKFHKEDQVFEHVKVVLESIVPKNIRNTIPSTNAKDYEPRKGEEVVFGSKLVSCKLDNQEFMNWDLRVLELRDKDWYKTNRRIAFRGSGNHPVYKSYCKIKTDYFNV